MILDFLRIGVDRDPLRGELIHVIEESLGADGPGLGLANLPGL